MKNTFVVRTALCLAATVAISGCHKHEMKSCPPETAGEISRVCFRLNTPAEEGTKGSVPGSDTTIKDINIFAYSKGMLEGEIYVNDSESAEMEMTAGKTYTFYVLVNTGDIDAPEKESDMQTYRYSLGSLQDFTDRGIPMSAVKTAGIKKAEEQVELLLSRLIARINLRLDTRALPGFRVTSARLVNSPADVTPFISASMATSVMSGDSATDEDLKLLNSGKTASFHMLENCQGVLLPSNNDQWEKIPENIPDGKEKLCTYVEVSAELDGSVGLEGPVTYRFYLGQDETSDFNVFRNTENDITLITTEDGLDKVSWKIDNSMLTSISVPVIAVGTDGYIFYTGSNGKFIPVKAGSEDWNCVAWGSGKYVAAGNKGAIACSTDGIRWRSVNAGSGNWKSVVAGKDMFVAAGEGGWIGYSYNGTDWQTMKINSSDWNSIAYGSGKFVVTGKSGSYYGSLGYSTDAIHWTVSSNTKYQYIQNSVIYGNGMFVATGKRSGYTGTSGCSSDGISWEMNTRTGSVEHTSTGFGNGTFITAGRNEFLTSSDGKNWTSIGKAPATDCKCIAYGNGIFVAVGSLSSGSVICYSSDTKHWVKASDNIEGIGINGICTMQ